MYLLLINALAGQEKYTETLAAMENFLKLFPDDRFAPQVAQKRDLLREELAHQSASRKEKPK
jgi:outer membrane protein assembly factor BamD (BamD/ComL family)